MIRLNYEVNYPFALIDAYRTSRRYEMSFHRHDFLFISKIIIKLPNSHVQVQHSTRCEDSPYSSLVLKPSWSTLATFPETS